LEDCIFCKIVRGEIPSWKVYEDEHAYAFLDINPVSAYHTLVIPKKHFVDSFDIPAEEFAHLMETLKKIVDLYHEKLGLENMQIVNSSGAEAQQDVFHIHYHIVPRSAGDGNNIQWKTHPELRDQFGAMLQKLAD